MRAAAAGLLTGALAFAAHSGAGGGPPSGGVVALLAVLAMTVTGVVWSSRFACHTVGLIALLAAAQVIAHLMQTVVGHSHHAWPVAAMVLAHTVAAVSGAVLIAAGDRLWAAMSAVARACVHSMCAVPGAARCAVATRVDVWSSALWFLGARSYRGPPAALLS